MNSTNGEAPVIGLTEAYIPVYFERFIVRSIADSMSVSRSSIERVIRFPLGELFSKLSCRRLTISAFIERPALIEAASINCFSVAGSRSFSCGSSRLMHQS